MTLGRGNGFLGSAGGGLWNIQREKRKGY